MAAFPLLTTIEDQPRREFEARPFQQEYQGRIFQRETRRVGERAIENVELVEIGEMRDVIPQQSGISVVSKARQQSACAAACPPSLVGFGLQPRPIKIGVVGHTDPRQILVMRRPNLCTMSSWMHDSQRLSESPGVQQPFADRHPVDAVRGTATL